MGKCGFGSFNNDWGMGAPKKATRCHPEPSKCTSLNITTRWGDAEIVRSWKAADKWEGVGAALRSNQGIMLEAQAARQPQPLPPPSLSPLDYDCEPRESPPAYFPAYPPSASIRRSAS